MINSGEISYDHLSKIYRIVGIWIIIIIVTLEHWTRVSNRRRNNTEKNNRTNHKSKKWDTSSNVVGSY